MSHNFLVEVDQLHAMNQERAVFIIDTRDPHEYSRAHIPHSVNIRDLFLYLSTTENGGLPAMIGHLSQLLSQAGLKKTDKVVVIDDALDNGYGQSCRAWFELKYLGHPDVSILHGGFRAWLAAGLSVTEDATLLEPTEYTPQIDPAMMATTEELLAAIDDPSVTILDNRDHAEWVGASSSPYGIDFCPRKGRIPGAVWVEWYRLMYRENGIPWFRTGHEIREVVREVGITPQSRVIVYCFKGSRASNTLMALKMAGIGHVKNYFQAWNEWSRHPELPIEAAY